jgi:VanZ family protein
VEDSLLTLAATEPEAPSRRKVSDGPESNERWRVWLLSYAPLFVWIGVIFFFSSNLGSSAHTSLIVEPLLEYFFPDMSEASREFVHACVRKTAHFTEYGILALAGIRAFASSAGTLFRLRWVFPVVVVAAVASLDEFNQSLEPSRTSSLWDVLLDISGGIVWTVVCYLIWHWKLTDHWRKRRTTTRDHHQYKL